jgi:hypothetical protein
VDGAVTKPIHADSEGQLSGSQLNIVQYPSGNDVSQAREPVWEQSVPIVHLSPIFAEHPIVPNDSANRMRANLELGGQNIGRTLPRRTDQKRPGLNK